MPVDCYATITTAWKGGYKPVDIYRVQEFDVDASMDTDTDQWSLTVGDPKAELVDVLSRDSEVRVSLFARDVKQFQVLQTGFADEIGFDTDGNLQFNGRDMTSVAVDSQAPPYQWRNMRPDTLIKMEARKLSIGSRLEIAPMAALKTIARDGSESYWEFWYRLVRKRSMWIWAEPDGALVSGFLDYNAKPSYKFGRPSGAFSSNNPGWIPVEHATWKKTTSNRIGEVFVMGHNKTTKFHARLLDDTITHWIKKPLKIMTDSTARTQNETNASAKEEIFESIVGAIEWNLVIANSDQIIRQNTTAQVNLPEIGLSGTFFVVGCKTFMSVGEGLYQVVRLRERNYALSKRSPTDPALGQDVGVDEFGAANAESPLDVRWANCFIYAANNHHGPWAMKDFMAVLIAMAQHESTLRDVKQGGTREHPYATGEDIKSIVTDPEWVRKFRQDFGGNDHNDDVGVGPMQLSTQSYKVAADKLYNPSVVDELVGGRWNPCSNIQEGAIVLRGKCGDVGAERGDQVPLPIEQLHDCVRAYNGAGPAAEAYANSVMAAVPGILSQVEAAMTTTPNSGAAMADMTPVAIGTRAQLAREILGYAQKGQYTNLSRGDTVGQIQAMARNETVKNQCGSHVYIDSQVLKTLLLLLDNGWKVGCSALAADHSCQVAGTSRVSRHPLGFACDISGLGKGSTGMLSIAGGGLTVTTLVIQAMDLIRLSLNPSQIICDGVGNVHVQSVANHQWTGGHLAPTFVVDGHRNHIHVGY